MSILKLLKSFDIFNSEAVRFLTQKALNIFLIETKFDKTGAVRVSSDKNSININIVNRPKTYKLLVSAQRKIEQRRAQERQVAKL